MFRNREPVWKVQLLDGTGKNLRPLPVGSGQIKVICHNGACAVTMVRGLHNITALLLPGVAVADLPEHCVGSCGDQRDGLEVNKMSYTCKADQTTTFHNIYL